MFLTEKIEVQKNRINVKKENSALYEIEMVYRHDCDICVTMYEAPDRDKKNAKFVFWHERNPLGYYISPDGLI